MPAASPVVDGVTVIVPALVPLAGDTLNQVALSEAVQSSEPPPVLEIVSVFAAGLAPPATAENESAAGETVGAYVARVFASQQLIIFIFRSRTF